MAATTVIDKCGGCGKQLYSGDMVSVLLRAKLTDQPKYRPYGTPPLPKGRLRVLIHRSYGNTAPCEDCVSRFAGARRSES